VLVDDLVEDIDEKIKIKEDLSGIYEVFV